MRDEVPGTTSYIGWRAKPFGVLIQQRKRPGCHVCLQLSAKHQSQQQIAYGEGYVSMSSYHCAFTTPCPLASCKTTLATNSFPQGRLLGGRERRRIQRASGRCAYDPPAARRSVLRECGQKNAERLGFRI